MENPIKNGMIWGENPLFSETSIWILINSWGFSYFCSDPEPKRQHALMALDLLNKRMSQEDIGAEAVGCYGDIFFIFQGLF